MGSLLEVGTDPSLLPPADGLPGGVSFPLPHTAGFVELGSLVQLHEGPPACHPNTLLINSILTQLSPGSSQESSVERGGFVLAFPFSFSGLV